MKHTLKHLAALLGIVAITGCAPWRGAWESAYPVPNVVPLAENDFYFAAPTGQTGAQSASSTTDLGHGK